MNGSVMLWGAIVFLSGLVAAGFWYIINSTNKRIEDSERNMKDAIKVISERIDDMEDKYSDIQKSLHAIEITLATSSTLERPMKTCVSYFERTVDKISTTIKTEIPMLITQAMVDFMKKEGYKWTK